MLLRNGLSVTTWTIHGLTLIRRGSLLANCGFPAFNKDTRGFYMRRSMYVAGILGEDMAT